MFSISMGIIPTWNLSYRISLCSYANASVSITLLTYPFNLLFKQSKYLNCHCHEITEKKFPWLWSTNCLTWGLDRRRHYKSFSLFLIHFFMCIALESQIKIETIFFRRVIIVGLVRWRQKSAESNSKPIPISFCSISYFFTENVR